MTSLLVDFPALKYSQLTNTNNMKKTLAENNFCINIQSDIYSRERSF